MTTHADMQLFIQLDQLLWVHIHKLHTKTVSYVHSMQGNSSHMLDMSSRASSSWNFCDLQPTLSRGHPTHTHSIHLRIWKKVTMCATDIFNLSHPPSPRFLPCLKSAVVLTRTCRHSVFVKYLNVLIYVEWLVQAYIHTHAQCSPISGGFTQAHPN